MPEVNKIGLLGGTFDPLHLGHLIIAESVLNNLGLHKIYFIPANKHALKSNQDISASKTRFEMLKLALHDFEYFYIIDIELQSENVSYTIDTLQKIKKYENLPDSELFYIIGYDNLAELHLWKDYEEIIDLVKFVIVGRPGDFNVKIPDNLKEKFIFPSTPIIDISSTMIRSYIKQNKAWKSLVPNKIYQFIIQNNLYKD
jgi:nicotinate-nucleotide adenylyltransferase